MNAMNPIEAAAEPGPHAVDIHVGARIRLRRKTLDMSQENLADYIGLTFQQVQKYERGTNRVSASKLWEIARALKCTTEHFFEGLDVATDLNAGGEESAVSEFLLTSEGIDLAQAFPKIAPKLRRRLLALAQAMAGTAEPEA